MPGLQPRGGTLSALQRFENRLEQMISGVFARTFRSAVQPVEIASALNREVDNSAQILSRDPVSYTHLTLPTIYSV